MKDLGNSENGMDEFFRIEDAIFKLHLSLKKYNKFKTETKNEKVKNLVILKNNLREIVKNSSVDYVSRQHLFARYKKLRAVIHDCLDLLDSPLDESFLGNLFIPEKEGEAQNSEDYTVFASRRPSQCIFHR